MRLIATRFVTVGFALSLLAASVSGAQARMENLVSRKIGHSSGTRIELPADIDFCRTSDAAYYEFLNDCIRLKAGHTVELLEFGGDWLKIKVVRPDSNDLLGYISRYVPDVNNRPDLNGVNW
ncbi:hypothetical protein [Aminobacter sp. BE322]|uniref:hypothetical protein n=1 Tax=unclassified Aminobacter TaxID=2644704 RepID=UPI003D24ED82